MIYSVYFNRDEIFGDRIGLEELEHYALVKHFSLLLNERGTLVRPEHVKRQVDSISLVVERLGEKNTFISFSAPNADYLELTSNKLFIGSIYKKSKKYYSGQVKVSKDSILRNGLQQSIALISTCPNSLLSINDLHKDLPIIAIPPPLWDHYSKLYQELNISSSILQTDGYTISNQLKGCRPKYVRHKIPLQRKLQSVFSALRKRKVKLAIEYLFRSGIIHFEPTTLLTSGIVYTTVVGANNPFKNYKTIISAFGEAFKSSTNATLIIKMAGRVRESQKRHMLNFLKNKSYRCPVVIINEHLNQHKYEELIKATHFVINLSSTDEIGNSLLEFMSAGKPLISTALSDHPSFNKRNTFFTEKSDAFRISLKNQLLKSYEVINDDPEAYISMSNASAKSMSEYCSLKQVRPLFNDFLDQLDI